MLTTRALYVLLRKAFPDSIEKYSKDYLTRLKVQKFMYLFMQFWKSDSYNYSWYLAGPYSAILTHQIYDEVLTADKEEKDEWESRKLTERASSVLNSINGLISAVKQKAGKRLEDSSAYELVASIWYIANRMSCNNEAVDLERIEKSLKINKPHFKDVKNLHQIIALVTESMNLVK